MKKLIFPCLLSIVLTLSGCSNDEPSPSPNEKDIDIENQVWGCRTTCYAHLLTSESDCESEELNELCYIVRVPKEGGNYSFALSADAIYNDHKGTSAVDAYDFIPRVLAEIQYDPSDELWFLPLYLPENKLKHVYDNSENVARIDTDWLKFDSHVGENRFTITIPENKEDGKRQFNVWFGPTSSNGCDRHLSYALVVIQE